MPDSSSAAKQSTDVNLEFRNVSSSSLHDLIHWVYSHYEREVRTEIIEGTHRQIQTLAEPNAFQGIEAIRDGMRVAAAYWVIYPGSVAILSGPHWTDDQASKSAIEIVRQLCQLAQGRNLEIVQCILDDSSSPCHEILLQGGMQRLAILIQMRSTLSRLADNQGNLSSRVTQLTDIDDALTMHRIDPNCLDGLHDVIKQSYIDSSDCPELNGLRTITATIDGYFGSAGCDPPSWWLMQRVGVPIGCVLLSRINCDEWELTYMGVVRSWRGKGIGRRLLEFAVSQCKQLGASSISLAVDQRNQSAIKLYRAFQFVPIRNLHALFWPCSMRAE